MNGNLQPQRADQTLLEAENTQREIARTSGGEVRVCYDCGDGFIGAWICQTWHTVQFFLSFYAKQPQQGCF